MKTVEEKLAYAIATIKAIQEMTCRSQVDTISINRVATIALGDLRGQDV